MVERQIGSLEVIVGPMYSGKSGELIDQIERQGFAEKSAILIKPSNDDRYSTTEVATHGGRKVEAYAVDREAPHIVLSTIMAIEAQRGSEIDVIGIDEGQFFANTETFVTDVETLVNAGKLIVIAGLPTDFADREFGAMPTLILKADKIVQKTAVCTFRDETGDVCGSDATKTQRLVDGQPANYNDPIIVVGSVDLYEARCRQHHFVEGKPAPDMSYQPPV